MKKKEKVSVKGFKTSAQARALRTRTTSFGVVFVRRKAITRSRRQGVVVRAPGKLEVTSLRRFGSQAEAKTHGRRFTRIQKHKSFRVVLVKKKPNAWVNPKTGKTNPILNKNRD